MLTLPVSTRVLVCREPIDMRRSFDGLEAAVRERLQENPLSGALFVFWNRRRDRLKVLSFDGTGLWIWYKRLEGGRFELPGQLGDSQRSLLRTCSWGSKGSNLAASEGDADGVEGLDTRKVSMRETRHLMALDPNTLPDDPVLLRGVISQLLGAVEKLERKNAWLQAEVEALFRKLFRKRSEKLDPNQLELVFEAMRDLGIPQVSWSNWSKRSVGKDVGAAPLVVSRCLGKALPRERIEHALPEHERCCTACGEELTKIREEVTRTARLHPGLFQDHRARARGVRLQEL